LTFPSPSKFERGYVLTLEVQSQHNLNQSATWIVGGRNVLIGCGVTTKRSGAQATRDIHVVAGRADQPVDVVESIQGLSAHFQIHALCELDLLRQAQVIAEERWSFDDQVVVSALTDDCLLAIGESSRSDKASGRRALRVDSARRRKRGVTRA